MQALSHGLTALLKVETGTDSYNCKEGSGVEVRGPPQVGITGI